MSTVDVVILGKVSAKVVVTHWRDNADHQVPSSAGKDRHFDIPSDGEALMVTLFVDAPHWASGYPDHWAIYAQEFRPSSTTVSRWEPHHSDRQPLHPRVTYRETSSAVGSSGANILLTFDLRFIDCTDLLRHVGTLRPDLDETKKSRNPADPEHSVIDTVETRPADSGIKIFAYTDGDPPLWAVTYSKSQFSSGDQNCHLIFFYRPKDMPPYKDGSNVNLYPVERYFCGRPDPRGPFYVMTPDANRPSDTGHWPSGIINCGYARQIVQSKKPVVLITPIASGGAYGDSKTLSTKGIIPAFLAALRDHGIGRANASDVNRDKMTIAVGGFSQGAGAAMHTLRNCLADIDQFYWFDPENPVASSAESEKTINDWLLGAAKSSRPRHVRFIGTLENPRMNGLAEQFRNLHYPNTESSCLTEPDYYRKDLLYKTAHAVPLQNPPDPLFPQTLLTFPEPFDPPGTTSLGPLSKESRLFASYTKDGKSVILTSVDFPKLTLTIAYTSPEVIAGLWRFLWRSPPGQMASSNIPLDTETKVREFFTGCVIFQTNNPMGVRHQWAVAGGKYEKNFQPDPRRPSREGMVGFLLDCIRQGNYS